MIAALSCSRPHPGARARPDVAEIVTLLLAFGADPNQRGINDWTALHHAVARRDLAAIRLLVAHGADPHMKTRIDDLASPLEDASAGGFTEAVAAMEQSSGRP